jgi:DNA-binding MarR family transcriptional regulator
MKQITHKESGLGDLLFIFRRNLIEGMKKEGLFHDLTFSQIEVLRFIGPKGKVTMRSIADHLKITPPSTTALVADLERKGLIKRKSDAKDRRIVYILFTQKTKKLFIKITRQKEAIFRSTFSKLSVQDQKDLERIIKILITE